MKPFPYDEFYPVFMEELKTIFSRFVEQNRDKKPYIFALTVREWMSFNYFECYHLDANGNTAVDFESQGMGSLAELDSRLKEWVAKREADGIPLDKETKRLRKFFGIASDALDYKYLVETWMNKTFTNNDFPKSDSMILAYITENEQNITDEEKYTEELTKFKTEFFDFLIKCLKQLRDEKYFESVYPERILIDFQVEEYYDNEEKMIHIFEELNTKEEAKLFARFLYG
jgi:hypothetical protein